MNLIKLCTLRVFLANQNTTIELVPSWTFPTSVHTFLVSHDQLHEAHIAVLMQKNIRIYPDKILVL